MILSWDTAPEPFSVGLLFNSYKLYALCSDPFVILFFSVVLFRENRNSFRPGDKGTLSRR